MKLREHNVFSRVCLSVILFMGDPCTGHWPAPHTGPWLWLHPTVQDPGCTLSLCNPLVLPPPPIHDPTLPHCTGPTPDIFKCVQLRPHCTGLPPSTRACSTSLTTKHRRSENKRLHSGDVEVVGKFCLVANNINVSNQFNFLSFL